MTALFKYRYVDSYESVEGEIEAENVTLAAIRVLDEEGAEPGRPRWKRYQISEKGLCAAPDNAELVVFDRHGDGTYHLEIRKAGTKKRKFLHLYA